MAFLERGILRAKGGKIELGADVVIRRTTANRLDLDDATQISGTANITGAARVGGALTAVSTVGVTGLATLNGGVASSGTVTLTGKFVAPYGTVVDGGTATALATNGEVAVTHKAHVPYLTFRSGGTPYYVALPSATHGTITVTVGGTI